MPCRARPRPTGRSTTSANRSPSSAGTASTSSSRRRAPTSPEGLAQVVVDRAVKIGSGRMDTPEAPRPKREEAQSASPEVTELAPGILRSQLPVFLPGLGHVNCYFLQDDRGVA